MWGRRVLNPKAVVKANVPTLTSVKQDTATKLTATLAAPVEKVDLADVALVRDDSHSVIAVKSVAVDTADATKLSIETYVDMIDGKAYTLTYTAQDEAKTQSTATFTATDGKIASFALTPATIPANKATTIKYSALDANGIVIYEKPIDDTANGIDIEVATDNGYVDSSKLTLFEVGNTAKVTVSYHTYNYDAQGNETGLIKNDFTVTAVENSVVPSGVKYTIVSGSNTVPAWENLTVNTKLATNDFEKYARFQIKDSNGDDITADCEYTVESSNDNIVLASGEAKGPVNLMPVKEGSAFLVLKDKDKTVTTLAITVVKARAIASFTLDKTSVAIANNANEVTNEAGSVSIGYAAKDQYGEDRKVDWKLDCKAAPSKEAKKPDVKLSATSAATDGTIFISTDSATIGNYTYSLTATDGEVTRTRTFTVNVKDVSKGDSSYALQFVKGSGVVSGAAATTTLNTTVTDNTDGPSVISVNLVKKVNTVVAGSANNVGVKSITVKGNNGKIYAATGSSVVTSAAIDDVAVAAVPSTTGPDGHLLNITAVSEADDGKIYTKNLPAGSYTVVLTFSDDKSISGTFKVEDKQAALTATVLKTNTGSNNDIKAVLEDKDFVKYVYGGVTQGTSEDNKVEVTKIYGREGKGKSIVISKVIVAVTVPGESKNKVNIEVPVNRVFTTTADSWTSSLTIIP